MLMMIGIIIGVGSVISGVVIGQGGEAMLKSQLSGEKNMREIFYEPSEEEYILIRMHFLNLHSVKRIFGSLKVYRKCSLL